uniref:Ci-meta1-like protein n=1 Tax=Herdmania curvata TaxID=62068 RepID=Q7YUE5_9ASCI|nr:ci-meta1-like protein [Herdmania curvata]
MSMQRIILFLFLAIFASSTAKAETCDAKAVCGKTDYGFTCTCNKGYEGTDGACVNIDECKLNISVCAEYETCNDLDGSFNCTCDDIDTTCSELAYCANVTDDFNTTAPTCLCRLGFTGNGSHCFDIDECLNVTTNDCHTNALCNNTFGSYVCSCNGGYEGDGVNCTDIDECETDTHDCQQPLSCVNSVGSFGCVCGRNGTCHDYAQCLFLSNASICVCNPGHIGDGVASCPDIDECSSPREDQCDANARCINTLGSYDCACKKGYTGDGSQCSNGNSVKYSCLLLLSFILSTLHVLV